MVPFWVQTYLIEVGYELDSIENLMPEKWYWFSALISPSLLKRILEKRKINGKKSWKRDDFGWSRK